MSTMLSILSTSSNVLMLQIDNVNAYDQNFISFKLEEALRIMKKEKPKPSTVSSHLPHSNSRRGSDYDGALLRIPASDAIV